MLVFMIVILVFQVWLIVLGERKSIQTANKLFAFLRKIEDPFQLFRVMHWSKLFAGTETALSDKENSRFELSRAVYIYFSLLKEQQVLNIPQVINTSFFYFIFKPC